MAGAVAAGTESLAAPDKLQALGEHAAACPRCRLAETRTQVVFGSGSPTAQLMFVGEAPGFHEDQQGVPFVGAAGKLLERLLGDIGLMRADVYIANVLKCRPPGNRDPLPDEIAACADYLARQTQQVQPRVIATLGRFSMARWFPGERISQIHGQSRVFDGVAVVPMYHPAAALRDGSLRAVMRQDFAQIPTLLASTPGTQ